MEKISALPRQPRSWLFWRHCTRPISSQRAMLHKQWRSTRAGSHNGRPSYVRTPCPDVVVVDPARHRVHADCRSIGLFVRLACSAKCLPKPDRYLAACDVYERSRHSVDWGRVSTRHTRSSTTYDSHAEAPSVDDGRCTADSSGGTRVDPGVCPSEALH